MLAIASGALVAACSGGGDEGATPLLDGTSSRKAPVELEGVRDPAVLTSATVVPISAIEADSAAGSCLFDRFGQLEARESAVVRIGVASESVTFREAGERAVFGCSNSPGPREENRRWCDGAYGQLYSGRLRDPRLGILCRTEGGVQMASAWVEPESDVRYVAVAQPEYTEVYEPAGGLPIRIATLSGVDIETSSATFDVSEHNEDGRLLRTYELEAFVAG